MAKLNEFLQSSSEYEEQLGNSSRDSTENEGGDNMETIKISGFNDSNLKKGSQIEDSISTSQSKKKRGRSSEDSPKVLIKKLERYSVFQ